MIGTANRLSCRIPVQLVRAGRGAATPVEDRPFWSRLVWFLGLDHVLVSPGKGSVFPHGANRPETKALEARLAIEDGARELDMVMNVGKFLAGDLHWVQRDIEAVVTEARRHPGVLVKVILETCYLSPPRIARACEIAKAAGADFVKTSTGFGDGPATPEAVQVMIGTVGGTMGIKPSGGIRHYATACRYLDMGVQRLGIASTEAVLNEATSE